MSGKPSGDSISADLLLDSTLASVDTAENAALSSAREMGFDEDDLHKVGIAVRETMVNAVAHGNRYSIRKKVRVKVWKGPIRLVIEIQDEGNGFELQTVPDPLADENLMRHSGRGLLMIQAFMDETDVRRAEPTGTCVRMTKYLRDPQSGAGF